MTNSPGPNGRLNLWTNCPWATQIAHMDAPYEASEIEKVEVHSSESHCLVTQGDCWVLQVELKPSAPIPEPGDTLFLWGKGLGFEVRGIATTRHLYRYETASEQVASQKRRQEDRDAASRKDWEEKGLAKFIDGMKELPLAFQKRLEFFMRNPDWGDSFGGYELFACQEAQKILKVCATTEEIRAFRDLPFEQQKAKAGIADGHSGNTFGAACMLANVALYAAKPDADVEVFQAHGALCPLVGCKEYGCYSSTLNQEEAAHAD